MSDITREHEFVNFLRVSHIASHYHQKIAIVRRQLDAWVADGLLLRSDTAADLFSGRTPILPIKLMDGSGKKATVCFVDLTAAGEAHIAEYFRNAIVSRQRYVDRWNISQSMTRKYGYRPYDQAPDQTPAGPHANRLIAIEKLAQRLNTSVQALEKDLAYMVQSGKARIFSTMAAVPEAYSYKPLMLVRDDRLTIYGFHPLHIVQACNFESYRCGGKGRTKLKAEEKAVQSRLVRLQTT